MAEMKAPADEKRMGSRFFVMIMRPLKTSSGLPPASAAAPASASARRATNPIANRLCMYCSRKEDSDCKPRRGVERQRNAPRQELDVEGATLVSRPAPGAEEGLEPEVVKRLEV